MRSRGEAKTTRRVLPGSGFSPPYSRGLMALRELGFQVGAAVMQVARAGSEEQVAKTRENLDETRRRIYELLAGEGDGSD